jgi:hypothetical protein
MVIVYGFVSLLAGLISCVLLWPYGATIALVSMPFGGSVFVLIAAILVYVRASRGSRSSDAHATHPRQPQNLQTTESRQ